VCVRARARVCARARARGSGSVQRPSDVTVFSREKGFVKK